MILITAASAHGGISLGIYLNPGEDYTTEINHFFADTRQHAIVQYALLWNANGATHTNIMNMVRTAGATPMCVWGSSGYSFNQILSGTVDGVIMDIAEAIRVFGDPVILAFDAEFNLDSSDYNGDPNAYRQVWKHVRGIFNSVGATNVQWAWVPNYASNPSTPGNDYNLYYPGDAYVDWVGALGFDCNWSTGPAYMSFDGIFLPILNDFQSRYPNKPQIIAWFGSAGASSFATYKAGWIQDSYNRMPSYPNLRAVVWYNDFAGGAPGPLDFRVWTDSVTSPVPENVTAAYRGAVNAAPFLGTLPPYNQLIPGGGGGGSGFTITLEPSTATGGDRLKISWAFSGIARVVDAYLAVELPDGTLLVMDSKMNFQSKIVPGASRFDVSGNPSGALSLGVPPGTAPGGYTFMAVCVPSGSSALNPSNYLGSGISSALFSIR